MPNKCVKCKKNVTGLRFPGLSCIICNKYFHSQCADISDKTIKDIIDSKLSWTCSTCKRRSVVLPLIDSSDDAQSQSSSSTKITANNQSKNLKKPSKTVTNSSSDTTSLLTERLSKLEELLNTALQRIEVLESQAAQPPLIQATDNSPLTASLSEKIHSLEARTASIAKQLSDDSLEIQGLPPGALENPLNSVIALSKELNCDITEDDLACAPIRSTTKLSITFKSKATRRNFLIAGKSFNRNKKKFSFNQQVCKVHVNEILSDPQRDLYRETKAFANLNNFKFVWVGIKGQILLKKSEGHTPYSISSPENLNHIRHEDLLPKLPRAENENTAMSPILTNA